MRRKKKSPATSEEDIRGLAATRAVEAAGIEAAKDGAASTREQRPTPRFPSENGAPICPGESRHVHLVWSFFGPLGPLAGRERQTLQP